MDTTLLTISLVSALLYLVLSGFRVLRQRPGGSSITTLLALVTLVTALLALNLPASPSAEARTVVIGLGAALVVAGIILLVIELRRADRQLNESRGILAIGTGVLLLVGLFAGPLIAQVVTQPLPSTAAVVSGAPAGVDDTLEMVAANGTPQVEPVASEPVVMPSASPTVMPSATPLPPRPTMPAPTPTNTPVSLATQVPTEAAPAEAGTTPLTACVGFIQNNLNLRAEPGTDAALLVTIPAGTAIDISGVSADGGWLSTSYGQLSGWVSAEYVQPGDNCNPSPVQSD